MLRRFCICSLRNYDFVHQFIRDMGVSIQQFAGKEQALGAFLLQFWLPCSRLWVFCRRHFAAPLFFQRLPGPNPLRMLFLVTQW